MKGAVRFFSLLLLLVLGMVLAAPVLAQSSTFGLSDADFQLLTSANAATSSAPSFHFFFTLDIFANVPDSDTVQGRLEGEGAMETRGASPAFQIQIGGDLTEGSTPVPVEAEVRLVDNILYYNAVDPETGQPTGWEGMPLSDLASMGSLMTGEGLPVDPTALAGGDLGIDPALQGMLSSLDPSEFIRMTRLPDEGGLAHFAIELSFTDLAQSDFLTGLVGMAMMGSMTDPSLGAGPMPTIDPAQLAMFGPMLAQMFGASNLRVDQYIDTATGLLYRTVFDLGLDIDASAVGETGTLQLGLLLDFTLTDIGVPQTITAPEGANIQSLGGDVQDLSNIITAVATPEVMPPIISTLPVLPTTQPPTTTSGGTITANTPVVVQLTGSGGVDLIYNGQVNEVISVTARSLEPEGVLDTTLEVLDASGTRLGYNDDHGTNRTDLAGFDSFLRDLKLVNGGAVTIRISTFTGAGVGRVEVLITSDATGTAAQPTPGTQTGAAEIISGNVPANGAFTQTITFNAGEVVTITVRSRSNTLDPRVRVIDSSNRTIAENDDHGTGAGDLDVYDSRISDLSIPAAGTYTLSVDGFGGSSGAFEMEIVRGGGGVITQPTPVIAQPTPSGQGQQSEVETVQGSITPRGVFTHTFSANAGDVYVITARATSDDFDPRVILLAGTQILADNDDHGSSDRALGPFDSRITNYIFQQSGQYTVEVRGYQDSAGPFELMLERVATGAPLGPGTDQVFTGQIAANGTFVQEFQAQAGDYLTISVRALTQNFDPRVALVSPDGVVVAANDDHGSNTPDLSFLDSRITNFYVEQSGTYSIEVSGYQDSAGSFALTVTTRR